MSSTLIKKCELKKHTFKISNTTDYINIKDVPEAITNRQFSLGHPPSGNSGNVSFGKKWPLTMKGKQVKIIINPEEGCQLFAPYGLSKMPIKEGYTGDTYSLGIKCHNESGLNETHEHIIAAFEAIRNFVVAAVIKQPAVYLGKGSVTHSEASSIIPMPFKFSSCIKDNCKIPDEEANKRTLYLKTKNFDNAKTAAMASIAKTKNISDEQVNKILMGSFGSIFYDISRVEETITRIDSHKRRRSSKYLQVSPVDTLYEVSESCRTGMRIHHIVISVDGLWSGQKITWQTKVLEVHFEPCGDNRQITAGVFEDVEEEDLNSDVELDISEITM